MRIKYHGKTKKTNYTKIKCKGSRKNKDRNRRARTKLQAIIWKYKSKALKNKEIKVKNSQNKPESVCAVTIKSLCVCMGYN